MLIDGNTGTGKTAVLALLRERGVQTLDLEGIARHRGSVLGPMPGGQPSQKGFESAIASVLAKLDRDRPLVLEAESSKVGARIVPPSLWKAMLHAPRIVLSASRPVRAEHLVDAYQDLWSDPALLDARLDQLIPFHGRNVVDVWRSLHKAGDLQTLAIDLMERHYDTRYARSRDRAEGSVSAKIEADRLDAGGVARVASQVAEVIKSL